MPILTIHQSTGILEIEIPTGSNLRRELLDRDISPYSRMTRKLNCGGNGLCATCGVEILSEPVPPTHWHDKLAHRYRYPRLSCQITVTKDMSIRIMEEKKVWGKRIRSRTE